MSAVSAAAGKAPKFATGWPYLRWGLLALIQLALISVPLVDRLQVQMTGTVVPLELVPVDPRDLLRGDYVIISLAIGNLSRDLPGADKVAAGETVYVKLDIADGVPARAVSVSQSPDPSAEIWIAGKVSSVSGNSLRIDYGIDAFFLPEGEGREIERLETSRVLLEVAIAEDGRSLPLTLLVDGKAFKSDGAF